MERSQTVLSLSPGGDCIVTASDDKTARVGRADTGELLAELKGHADRSASAAFSLDGARVVTASADKTARVWELDPIPGDASVLSLWVEVRTGTEFKGGVVRPLSLNEWEGR